jgi:hypothetical protein
MTASTTTRPTTTEPAPTAARRPGARRHPVTGRASSDLGGQLERAATR